MWKWKITEGRKIAINKIATSSADNKKLNIYSNRVISPAADSYERPVEAHLRPNSSAHCHLEVPTLKASRAAALTTQDEIAVDLFDDLKNSSKNFQKRRVCQ
jgi:hypothetical protein